MKCLLSAPQFVTFSHRDWMTNPKQQEAIVVGHAGGTGRVAGWCGALLCETPDKRRFKAWQGDVCQDFARGILRGPFHISPSQ